MDASDGDDAPETQGTRDARHKDPVPSVDSNPLVSLLGQLRTVWRKPRVRVGAVMTLGVALPGIMELVGAAEIPPAAIALLAVALAALFLSVERAISASAPESKVRWLVVALGIALALPLGGWGYHVLFESAQRSYAFYLDADPAQQLQSSGMPGAPAQLVGSSISGGNSHHFDCHAFDEAGRVWLRSSWYSSDGEYWFEARYFVPVGDFTARDLPRCD